nr:hypothetical protein [Tanacetum cinerariifolium]
EIREDPRFYPYFKTSFIAVCSLHVICEVLPAKDCVGVISGIYFPVILGVDEQGPFRNKNGALSQSVIASCSFDMKFHNVLAGIIAPYAGAPYGLLEHENGFKPQDAKELFNHRHSLVRNITDKTLVAQKERFPILMLAPSYPLPTQVKLVVAACALHNYIRDEKPDDIIFKIYEHEG